MIKLNKKNKEIKERKSLVWYGLRISFWYMIFYFVFGFIYLFLFLDFTNVEIPKIISFLALIMLFIFPLNFVLSIIHLTQYKSKTIAALSLILSSLMILAGIFCLVFL